MALLQRKMLRRSSGGTPRTSASTCSDSSAEMSVTASKLPLSSTSSTIRRATSRMPSSSRCTLRGVNAWLMSLR
jgi:hypothetical protein